MYDVKKSVERNNEVRGICDFIQEIHCWTWTIKSVERNNDVRGISDFIQEIHCLTWTKKVLRGTTRSQGDMRLNTGNTMYDVENKKCWEE